MMDKLLSRNIIILIILIILALLSFSFIKNNFFTNEKIVLDNVKLREELSNDFFSLLIEQEDGTYEESTDNSWPSNMRFNTELSGCVNISGNKINNALSFDYVNNTVNVSAGETQFCYLYFDLPKPSVTLTVSTDGTNNTLPTYNHYKQTLTCDDGTSSYFNVKYQRIEISNVSNTYTNCNLNYTNDTNSYTLLKTQVESDNTTDNNGYRYSGKQPNNFVWFNNELWRIIGSIPTTLSDGVTIENRVKIIRAESIGGLAYHSASSNTTWGSGNTLYTLLNSYYYGKKDATGGSPCYGTSSTGYALCNYTNKGISSSPSDYYGRMVIGVYMNAGTVSSTYTTVSAAYTAEASTLTSSVAKIGLMSASDYGYATSNIAYSSVNLSGLSSYEQDNWLYGQSYEWTMTPRSTNYVNYMDINGFLSYSNADLGRTVRPVLYLDSNVYIISGNGTESNPYILGM